jgi:hypothetical protein
VEISPFRLEILLTVLTAGGTGTTANSYCCGSKVCSGVGNGCTVVNRRKGIKNPDLHDYSETKKWE